MNHKNIYINEIEAGKSFFDEIFSVQEIRLHNTKNGEPYYRLTLQDRTGEIGARIWKDSFDSCKGLETLKIGDVVTVDFDAVLFNDSIQLIVKRLTKSVDFDITELVKASTQDIDAMWDKINKRIDNLNDAELKKLLKNIFNTEFIDIYKRAPGSEIVHHDYIGGLMEHTLEMLAIADSAVKFYPRVNQDLVTVGIILHDIGKVYELSISGASIIRNKEGFLMGHIMLGVELILKHLPKNFSDEKKTLLIHILLSHHHEIEYGAVVKPATLEAAFVAFADYMSSHLRQFDKELATKRPDSLGFGEWQKYLGVKIYFGEKMNATEKSDNDKTLASNDSNENSH